MPVCRVWQVQARVPFLNVHFARQDRCISRGSCKTSKIRETFEEYFLPPFLEQNCCKRQSVPALVPST